MIVKCIDNQPYPVLEKGKKYHAFRCVIYKFHSEVYLEEFPCETFNSVVFGEDFNKELSKAIDYFRENSSRDYFGVFERRF